MPGNITNQVYDLTNVTGSENLLEFVQGVNNLTDQWFMLGILIAVFIILFTALQSPTTSARDALGAASFITAVLSLFFITLEFISLGIALLLIIIAGLIFIFIVLKDQ